MLLISCKGQATLALSIQSEASDRAAGQGLGPSSAGSRIKRIGQETCHGWLDDRDAFPILGYGPGARGMGHDPEKDGARGHMFKGSSVLHSFSMLFRCCGFLLRKWMYIMS